MKYKVVLLGAFPPGVHQYEIDKSLRELGHTVFTAGPSGPASMPALAAALKALDPDYRYDLDTRADTALSDILAACGFAPDFVLYLESGFAFLPPDLAFAPCPTLGLLTEDHLHADWNSSLFPYFDVILATWKRTVENYRAQGHDNLRQWYFGARPAWCVDEGLERVYDVAFVGNLNPRVQRGRNLVLEKILRLRKDGLRVWMGSQVFFRDYNRIHGQSKIVYHDSITGQVNMRVFEAMAAGCLVVMPRPRDMDDPSSRLFQHDREILYCESDTEALEMIRYCASPSGEADRRRIAEAGKAKVMTGHGYRERVQELLAGIVSRLSGEFLEERRVRLGRHRKDDRRRRLDLARYYGLFGAGDAAKRQLHGIRDWERDAEALQSLGVTEALSGNPPAAFDCLQRAAHQDSSAVLASVNLATVARTAQRADWLGHCENALERLQTEGAAGLDGPYFPCPYDRFRLEVSAAYFAHPSGTERNAALARLYRYRLHDLAGRAHLAESRPSEAVPHFDKALELVPDDGYLLHARGLARAALGDLDGAIRDLARATEMEPFFAQARWELAEACLRAGRLEEAFRAHQDLLGCMPEMQVPKELWRRIGDVALRLRRVAEARTAYERVLVEMPGDLELRGRVATLRALTEGIVARESVPV